MNLNLPNIGSDVKPSLFQPGVIGSNFIRSVHENESKTASELDDEGDDSLTASFIELNGNDEASIGYELGVAITEKTSIKKIT